MDPKLELHTWHNTVRQITISVSEEIPTVGAAVSTLLGVFWPKDEKTVFQLAEKEVTELIDKKIRAFEFGLINGLVDKLRTSLNKYKEMGCQAADLRIVMADVDGLYSHLHTSVYARHLMPQVVTAFQTHLMVMRELKYHQKDIYKGTLNWAEDVKRTYNKYKKLVEGTYEAWNKWRTDRIETYVETDSGEQGSQNYGHTLDRVTGERVDFVYEGSAPHPGFKEEVRATKERMQRLAQARFAGLVCHCWEFKDYLQNELFRADVTLSKLQYLLIGPFSSATVGSKQAYGYYGPTQYDDSFEGDGPARKLTLYAAKAVHGLELACEDMYSGIIGARKGSEHEIQMAYETSSQKDWHRFIGAEVQFSESVLCGLSLVTGAEGKTPTASPVFGNADGWAVKSAKFDIATDFALTGLAHATRHSNEAGGECVSVVGFYFRYSPFRRR